MRALNSPRSLSGANEVVGARRGLHPTSPDASNTASVGPAQKARTLRDVRTGRRWLYISRRKRISMIRKEFTSAIHSLSEKSRSITFTASTPAIDRYGDSISPDGFLLENFRRNPVFLFSHRSSDPPIGKVTSISIERGKALVATVQFATKEVYPFAETCYQLHKNGFLQAVSVGFLPKESEPIIDSSTGRQTGERFLKQELLEISSVQVPANAECLARAVHKGVVSESESREFVRRSIGEVRLPDDFLAALDCEEAASREIRSLEELFAALRK
jgi:uncharacterized protein